MNAAEFHAQRRFLDTAAGRIAYLDQGTGPAALLLHAFPMNGFQWRGVLPQLSAQRRCIVPDMLGLGYSEPAVGQALTPHGQVQMLTGLLAALDIDAVDLIANDSGGLFAQLFAASFPSRVRSLLLTNCDVHENCPPPALEPFLEPARQGILADRFITRQLQDRSIALSSKGLGGFGYRQPANFTAECAEVYLQPLVSSAQRKQQFHDFVLGLAGNCLLPIAEDLQRLAAPVRLVWATHDPFFPVATAEWLDRTLGNSRGLRRIEGAKLYFPEEMPDIIVAEALALWGIAAALPRAAAPAA
jgi:pimeloyl-ACP methyl ester carboxylesterase